MNPRTILSSAAVLAVALAIGCDGRIDPASGPEQSADALTVCAGGPTLSGIDVSHWDGFIDWRQVAGSGRKFAYTAATVGNYFQDSSFGRNWSGIKDAGLQRGAYHWLDGTVGGKEQADFFLNYVGHLGAGDLPPMLDWECNDRSCGNAGSASVGQDVQAARDFIAEVKARTGMPTIIYTDPGFWDGIGDPGGFGNDPFWIADYGPSCPDVPSPFSGWVFWQHSSSGSVPGVPSSVDLDEFHGDMLQLRALAQGGGSAPAAPLVVYQPTGNGSITATNWADGHAEVFARTEHGRVVHAWTDGETDRWTRAEELDGSASCGLSAALSSDTASTVQLFDSSASSGRQVQRSFYDKGWQRLEDFGGRGLTQPASLNWQDGRVEVFALADDHEIYHKYWDHQRHRFEGWYSLGGSLATGPSAILNAKDEALLFALDRDGQPWFNRSARSSGGWIGWHAMGGKLAGRPVPVRDAHGVIWVFGVAPDGVLYSVRSRSNGDFTHWEAIDRGYQIQGDPSPVLDQGSVKVFARNLSDEVVFTTLDKHGFSHFERRGALTIASDPFAWQMPDGRASVFAVSKTHELSQTFRGKDGWTGWRTLARGVDACPAPAPEAVCPAGDGLYCGGHEVAGEKGDLYECRNGQLTLVQSCASGCDPQGGGSHDQCAPANACPNGDCQGMVAFTKLEDFTSGQGQTSYAVLAVFTQIASQTQSCDQTVGACCYSASGGAAAQSPLDLGSIALSDDGKSLGTLSYGSTGYDLLGCSSGVGSGCDSQLLWNGGDLLAAAAQSFSLQVKAPDDLASVSPDPSVEQPASASSGYTVSWQPSGNAQAKVALVLSLESAQGTIHCAVQDSQGSITVDPQLIQNLPQGAVAAALLSRNTSQSDQKQPFSLAADSSILAQVQIQP
ncbi:MAG: GH25 family lysozyme [Deltaproteobacteria bacterium]